MAGKTSPATKHGEGRPVGACIYRKLPNGTYVAIPPAQNGINLVGTEVTEFYSDSLFPGDWNDDGRVDLAGSGAVTIPGSDSGYALWSSNLSTTNSWIKVTLPTVTGFFVGKATIEVFDAGAVGDPTRLVSSTAFSDSFGQLVLLEKRGERHFASRGIVDAHLEWRTPKLGAVLTFDLFNVVGGSALVDINTVITDQSLSDPTEKFGAARRRMSPRSLRVGLRVD